MFACIRAGLGVFVFIDFGPCAVVEDTRLDFEAHKRTLACSITRSAGTKCATVVFFTSFIELFDSYGPGGRFINSSWARAIITGVCFSEGLRVCIVIIRIVMRVEARWGGAVANITEESWRRRTRSTRSRGGRS